mmetsp:Transcript_35304/g.94575  ORF Transcript_35304/g.94575 Transcript_35304/m.94575 type:complete len:528 (-) Transcript_35304:23-1606(-)
MNFSNDDFIRTTEQRHKDAVVELWRMLEEKGHIYLGAYEGWYSVRDEAYYTESELVDGKAPTGAEVEWVVKEPSYFFKLSEWGDKLLEYYDSHPDFIGPNSRRNEVISFVKGGLRDLSISRTTFEWGINVPDQPVPTSDDDPNHIMYVWVDALTNYLSALGFPGGDKFERFWPAGVQMVGKDIIRFHAVYWPALLLAAGLEPPQRIFAHGWWTRDGQKISKSIGNVIDPTELVSTFGVDQVRYFLMAEVPFGQDGDYSETAMLATANGFLANALGNLQMRVMSLVHKNCDGQVPEPGLLNADDEAMLEAARTLHGKMAPLVACQSLNKACGEMEVVVRMANKYIDEQAPWALKKTDVPRMKTVLWTLMETLRHVAVCCLPLMPASADCMLDQLAVKSEHRTFSSLALAEAMVMAGTPVVKPAGLFPRIELEETLTADTSSAEGAGSAADGEAAKEADPEMVEALRVEIAAAAEAVKAAKSGGADKGTIQPLVDALLALKAEFLELTGTPFDPPKTKKKKKKKKEEVA